MIYIKNNKGCIMQEFFDISNYSFEYNDFLKKELEKLINDIKNKNLKTILIFNDFGIQHAGNYFNFFLIKIIAEKYNLKIIFLYDFLAQESYKLKLNTKKNFLFFYYQKKLSQIFKNSNFNFFNEFNNFFKKSYCSYSFDTKEDYLYHAFIFCESFFPNSILYLGFEKLFTEYLKNKKFNLNFYFHPLILFKNKKLTKSQNISKFENFLINKNDINIINFKKFDNFQFKIGQKFTKQFFNKVII